MAKIIEPLLITKFLIGYFRILMFYGRKKRNRPKICFFCFRTRSRDRTGTASLPLVFETSASTNSAIRAALIVMQSCGHAVVQSCGHAVVQSCGHAVLRSAKIDYFFQIPAFHCCLLPTASSIERSIPSASYPHSCHSSCWVPCPTK